jgi:hypothetical protein
VPVAYESFSIDSVADTSDTSIDPAKPTGLAAGDLLLGIGGCIDSRTISPPTGWTQLTSHSDTASRVTTWKRTADSGDAAASTFPFTVSAGFSQGGVILLRISGADATAIADTYSDQPNASSANCPDVTPAVANSLIVWGLYQAASVSPMSADRGTERVDTNIPASGAFGVYTEAVAATTLQTGAVITKSGFGANVTFGITVAPSGGGGGAVGAAAERPFRRRRRGAALLRM